VYKRGIAFANIPTTLLAMADAALGGKTGVDLQGFKNIIGVFRMPLAVWIHPGLLATLPPRERRAGFAEIAKHALIADRNAFFRLCRLRQLPRDPLQWIRFSVRAKTRFTGRDFLENDIREALNFGHTAGHAMESYFLKKRKPLPHGEAVAAGMLCESHISHMRGLISAEELSRISGFMNKHYRLPVVPPRVFGRIIRMMKQDKKNRSGAIRMTLLDGIGSCMTGQRVKADEIVRSLHYYNFVRK
jgi:3-dehydroquinate synthase